MRKGQTQVGIITPEKVQLLAAQSCHAQCLGLVKLVVLAFKLTPTDLYLCISIAGL